MGKLHYVMRRFCTFAVVAGVTVILSALAPTVGEAATITQKFTFDATGSSQFAQFNPADGQLVSVTISVSDYGNVVLQFPTGPAPGLPDNYITELGGTYSYGLEAPASPAALILGSINATLPPFVCAFSIPSCDGAVGSAFSFFNTKVLAAVQSSPYIGTGDASLIAVFAYGDAIDPQVLITDGSGGTITYLYNPVAPTVTPLPGALPLFIGGLGALGLFGWRGKRKAQAVAAWTN
jgi:hypothetical protein